ncbi:MAG: Flp pilus assembly complex ATPase component TadA [Deltaproteobacteria bacterium]|nr:Flp pilus assembly complex ATPase component TadA [Deltaproteobacteria bacterium]
MQIASLVENARRRGASDLHLEPGMPAAMRVRGALQVDGNPLKGATLLEMARELVGEGGWADFVARRSFDASRVVAGTRVRVNVLQTARGVGLAIRLLGQSQPTLERLNLHPDLGALVQHAAGLVLVCGPTGAGKTSTLAALVEQVNTTRACHVLTLEAPIEVLFRPRRAFIRQREVGRDTPSFEQGLVDALREDPDVLVVGEMREPEIMRLTLAAAETGHLVLATLHAATPAEAITRMVSAFPAEAQSGVQAQLAACLRAIVCQRLAFYPAAQRLVPELEVCVATDAVRNHIREGQAHRVRTAMETGAGEGQWTLARYRRWLQDRSTFHSGAGEAPLAEEPGDAALRPGRALPAMGTARAAAPPSSPPSTGSSAVVISDEVLGVDDLIRQIEGN